MLALSLPLLQLFLPASYILVSYVTKQVLSLSTLSSPFVPFVDVSVKYPRVAAGALLYLWTWSVQDSLGSRLVTLMWVLSTVLLWDVKFLESASYPLVGPLTCIVLVTFAGLQIVNAWFDIESLD